jgi:hypothetical protein
LFLFLCILFFGCQLYWGWRFESIKSSGNLFTKLTQCPCLSFTAAPEVLNFSIKNFGPAAFLGLAFTSRLLGIEGSFCCELFLPSFFFFLSQVSLLLPLYMLLVFRCRRSFCVYLLDFWWLLNFKMERLIR